MPSIPALCRPTRAALHLGRVVPSTTALVVVGLVLTFPPVFEAFEAE